MKTIRSSLFFTLSLYVAVWVAFFVNDRFGFRRGANDLDLTLFTFAFSILAIGFSFVRSLYQAIRVDESYWLVAVLHVFFTFMLLFYFAN